MQKIGILLAAAVYLSAAAVSSPRFTPLHCEAGITTGHNDYLPTGRFALDDQHETGHVVLDAGKGIVAWCGRMDDGTGFETECQIDSCPNVDESHLFNGCIPLVQSFTQPTNQMSRLILWRSLCDGPWVFCH